MKERKLSLLIIVGIIMFILIGQAVMTPSKLQDAYNNGYLDGAKEACEIMLYVYEPVVAIDCREIMTAVRLGR